MPSAKAIIVIAIAANIMKHNMLAFISKPSSIVEYCTVALAE